MADVENELDQQLLIAEQRAREQVRNSADQGRLMRVEERQRLTKEKEEMRQRLESEMDELKSNIHRLQQMETMLQKESNRGDQTKELKIKVQVCE
jgi:hypothetical protein